MGAQHQNFGLRGDTHTPRDVGTTVWVSFHENRTTLSAHHLFFTAVRPAVVTRRVDRHFGWETYLKGQAEDPRPFISGAATAPMLQACHE
jgi:hypothetical protein